MQVYGTIRECWRCGKVKKMHGRVNGIVYCMACFGKHRYATDPVYRAKHQKTVLAYIEKNRERVYAYNKEYTRKRRLVDPEFKKRLNEYSKAYQKAKREKKKMGKEI
jgi:hypothetical protein